MAKRRQRAAPSPPSTATGTGTRTGPAAKRKRRSTATKGTADALPGAAYWRRLAPGLHIDDPAFQAECVPLALPPDRIRQVRAQLLRDGFFTLHPKELPWAPSLRAMRIGVRRLLRRGWPASMLLIFDEAWAMAHQLSTIMRAVSGNVNSLDTLAWSITPSIGQAGFAPHRDRQPADVKGSFRADGTPKYATCWVALSEASVDSSCLYIVP